MLTFGLGARERTQEGDEGGVDGQKEQAWSRGDGGVGASVGGRVRQDAVVIVS
jgi:hypothetical protein